MVSRLASSRQSSSLSVVVGDVIDVASVYQTHLWQRFTLYVCNMYIELPMNNIVRTMKSFFAVLVELWWMLINTVMGDWGNR